MTDPVNFDDYAEQYDRLLREDTSFFSSSEAYFAKYKVDLMAHQINWPISRLLEYGCGTGRNIPFLKQAFPNAEIVGLDISAASLEVARRNNAGIKFVQEDKWEEPLGQFDLVFVAGVFHHVPFKLHLTVAGTLWKYLFPSSFLFVFEHNPYNPVTRHIVNHCPYDKDAVLVKPKELQDVLVRSGFAIERKEYCLFFPPRFSLLNQLEKKLGWVPLGGQYWIQARHSV